MSEVTDFLTWSRGKSRSEQAEQAERNFESILTLCDERWFDPGVLLLHRRHRPAVLDHLGNTWGLAKSINALAEGLFGVISSAADLDDPTLLGNLATFLSLMMDRYAPALGDDRDAVCGHFEAITQRVVADYVRVVEPQADRLADVVTSVCDFVRQRGPDAGRVVLMEFPVGNSIPVKLVERVVVAEGCRVVTPKVALSRKDTSGRRPAVQDLARERLKELNLQAGDLVVYIDEWVTGTNFQTISAALSAAVAGTAGAAFLPVGMLTPESERDPGFDAKRAQHDRLLAALERAGGDFRFVFPPLPARFPRPKGTHFFWSEHDRTSGYRKMQIHGSMFSSIDAAVAELSDDGAFQRAWFAMLENEAENLAGVTGVSDVTMRRLDVARELWQKSREAYLRCKPELEKIDHPSNRGEVDDPEAAVREVGVAFSDIIERGGAKICVRVALEHLRIQPGIDPANRYAFRGQTPVITELTEPARSFHRYLMDALRRRLEVAARDPGRAGGE